jgi:hypothetical protein
MDAKKRKLLAALDRVLHTEVGQRQKRDSFQPGEASTASVGSGRLFSTSSPTLSSPIPIFTANHPKYANNHLPQKIHHRGTETPRHDNVEMNFVVNLVANFCHKRALDIGRSARAAPLQLINVTILVGPLQRNIDLSATSGPKIRACGSGEPRLRSKTFRVAPNIRFEMETV